MTFQRSDTIDGRYTVAFPLDENDHGETYRVRTPQGQLCFLRLFCLDTLPTQMIDDHGDVAEIALRRRLSHPALCPFVGEGTFTHGGLRYSYMLTQYVSSETLASRLQRQNMMPVAQARQLVLALLGLLRFLHRQQPQPVAHGRIDAGHILLDLTGEAGDMRLTGLGAAVHDAEAAVKDDLRAVGRLFYRLCFGQEPTQPPRLPNISVEGMDQQLLSTIAYALGDEGFASADDMLQAVMGNRHVSVGAAPSATSATQQHRGNGFADVAGMDQLKQLLQESVLYVLRDRERAERYNLEIPNGMLLYGPPGCGKTFLAERFAEEAGYNYLFVKSSDLASTYIHGTQQKIGNLFDEARLKAPTILCFDEFDALVPSRGERHNANMAGEVNEFLSQLNNCAKDRVFVIATTNKPELIDSAVLRRGRIDHIVFVPMPDEAARAALFAIHLAKRPCAPDIDHRRLARLSDGYIASEIAYVCNQAALQASRTDDDISQQLLERTLRATKPRTTADTCRYYEKMRQRMEQIQQERPRIGF